MKSLNLVLRKLLLLILLAMIATGCATSGYSKFYNQVKYEEFSPTEKCKAYSYTEDGKEKLLSEDYFIIGYSSFNGPLENQSNAISHGKKIGADIVLLKSEYKSTTQATLSLPQYHAGQTYTVNSHESGNANAYGSAYGSGGSVYGSAYGSYSGNKTTYINTPGYTTYQQVPYSVHRYDQEAIYFRKSR